MLAAVFASEFSLSGLSTIVYRQTMKKNYYQLLQVDPQASFEVIEKAYKTLCLKYHPDLQSPAKKAEAEEILKQLNIAYQVLKNPQARAAYDRQLTYEPFKVWLHSGLIGLIKYWYEK